MQFGAPPPDFNVTTPAGPRAISQLRGKPLVINFWATWCPPCTDELPYFDLLAREYGNRVRLVMVDWNEDPGVAQAYLKAHDMPLPEVDDAAGAIYKEYSLTKVPDTVVLDAEGKVTYVSVGGLSWEELDQAVRADLAHP